MAHAIRSGRDAALEQVYGKALWDRPTALLVTRDSGLMVAGYTTSQGTWHEDFWLLRLDDRGRLDASRR